MTKTLMTKTPIYLCPVIYLIGPCRGHLSHVFFQAVLFLSSELKRTQVDCRMTLDTF